MTVVTKILDQMSFIPKPQRKFLSTLFVTILTLRGRANFLNMSRYSDYHERTFRRQFKSEFNFPQFNQLAINQVIIDEPDLLVAQDASFVPKSGKRSYGLDSFWNGCTHRSERGQELSLISIVDVTRHTAFALSAEQTPPRPPQDEKKKTTPRQRTPQPSRMDFYLEHLRRSRPLLPVQIRYGVFDGAFAKHDFVHGVLAQGLHVISRLRCDANLRYLYTGAQTGRGRPRLYDGKVTFTDLSRFAYEAEVRPGIHLYTTLVYSISLKLRLRVCVAVNRSKPDKPTFVVLCSTDDDLSATTIFTYYAARFQMEYLFRDAKQFAGLTHCQARDQASLHFHFNASFSTVNLAKIESVLEANRPERKIFSLASYKQRAFNEHFLNLFISKLALEPNLIKIHPQYEYLKNYGAIAA
ncbi:MAG: transposase [Acidobacteriota bacterium]|nr:transposase [Acidobacteriota bacterium]